MLRACRPTKQSLSWSVSLWASRSRYLFHHLAHYAAFPHLDVLSITQSLHLRHPVLSDSLASPHLNLADPAERHIVNPKKSGPFHHRAPSRILFKAIRGMVPHKTARGAAALKRLSLFEGVPPAQDKVKKMVVPSALRVLRLKPGRKYCTLKRVSHEVGWGYRDVVDRLEEKRKVKGQAYHERKQAALKIRAKAEASVPKSDALVAAGY
jgi:hypothetical protein